MIALEIKDNNKKKHNFKIPTLDELTVKQFIDIAKMMEETKDGIEQKIKYICYFTGFSAIQIKESNLRIMQIVSIVSGEFKDYTKFVYPGYVYINGKHYYSKGITDFGQRVLIEQMADKLEGFEMYVFCVAVALRAKNLNYDLESVLKFKKHLMGKNWYQIIGAGHFFFLQYLITYKKGMRLFQRLNFRLMMMVSGFRQTRTGSKILAWFTN